MNISIEFQNPNVQRLQYNISITSCVAKPCIMRALESFHKYNFYLTKKFYL